MATKLWNKLVRQVTWKKASSQLLHSILSERDSVPPKISPLEENPVLILPLHHPLHYPLQDPHTFILLILWCKLYKNIKFSFSNFKYNICIHDFECFLKHIPVRKILDVSIHAAANRHLREKNWNTNLECLI